MDPYPEDLAEFDAPKATQPLHLKADGPVTISDPLTQAVNRLAQAVEQLTLATLDSAKQSAWTGTDVSKAPPLAALPPVSSGAPQTPDVTFDGCPIHHQPWKVVPAGISKKSGKAYTAFKACPVSGCDQRPKL